MKEEFIKFLKKHGAYRKFRKNLKRDGWRNTVHEFSYFGVYNIAIAFAWYDTTEGYNYWNELDKKWKEWLTQK